MEREGDKGSTAIVAGERGRRERGRLVAARSRGGGRGWMRDDGWSK